MNVVEFIRKKREGLEHSFEEMRDFLTAFIDGEIKDYQMSAWLMAVFMKGMSVKETMNWTKLMWHSGRTIPRNHREDFWVDKHSTGGVGDKTSLILVPLVASTTNRLFGDKKVKIPMISARGLGHTGGTIDKLESVSGFKSVVPFDDALLLLEKNGFFMISQTNEIAPADKLIYSIRDVTATVESLPLIVSSIMSKKLAENIDGIVFDVKVGRGAFMKTEKEAYALSEALVRVSKASGIEPVAILTSMDEPLGYCVGHQLEVEECSDFLEGYIREHGLLEVVLTLSSWMVFLGGRKKISLSDCRAECENELMSNRPQELFRKMFEAQGGRLDNFERSREKLPDDLEVARFRSDIDGVIKEIDAERIAKVLSILGATRLTTNSDIDRRVGIRFEKKVGDFVKSGDIVAEIFYRSQSEGLYEKDLEKAINIVNEPATDKKYIIGVCYES